MQFLSPIAENCLPPCRTSRAYNGAWHVIGMEELEVGRRERNKQLLFSLFLPPPTCAAPQERARCLREPPKPCFGKMARGWEFRTDPEWAGTGLSKLQNPTMEAWVG